MRLNPIAGLMTSLIVMALPAHAYDIDFGQGPAAPTICTADPAGLGAAVLCGNGQYLSQSFGDIAGVSDITYSSPRISMTPSLLWWATDYNNLYGVAWAAGGDGNSRARIEILAVNPTDRVTLNSFDLGAWPNTTRGTTVNVYAVGGGAPLFTYSGNVGEQPGNTATPFAPGVSAVGGLWIEFQDSAYNVGIDNVNYSVSAVPESDTAAMLALGLAGLGVAARRRRG